MQSKKWGLEGRLNPLGFLFCTINSVKEVIVLPMAKNPKTDEAFALYKQGLKLIDIAKQLEQDVIHM